MLITIHRVPSILIARNWIQIMLKIIIKVTAYLNSLLGVYTFFTGSLNNVILIMTIKQY